MRATSIDSADILERSFPGRRAQLKRDILRQALVCFNEYGVEATTIDMIKVQCDTSVGAIYHHFRNKDGLVAALFFMALEDQTRLLEQYLKTANTAKEGVVAVVFSYVDWVVAQPDCARFQFQARYSVATGPFREELTTRNRLRNKQLLEWLAKPGRGDQLNRLPAELMPSLIIGQAENYCRAWLSGRVNGSPSAYREILAEAAWRSVGGE